MAGIRAGTLNIELVAEVARLQADMDRVKKLVRNASDDIARSARAANDNLAGMSSGIAKAGSSSRLAGHHVQNLAFQFQDLGVQLASGANPLTAFIQQGSQISGVMAQAGIGVKGLAMELLALAAPFAPVIAAVGALALGIGLMSSEIEKNTGTTISWKNTALGAYDAVRELVAEKLTSAFAYFGTTTGEVWNKIVEYTKWGVNKMIGLSMAVPKAIYDTWGLIPAGVADIFLSAVNTGIDAINALIRKSVEGINSFLAQANKVLDQFGLGIGPLSAPQIDKVANSYAGAGKVMAGAMVKSLRDTMTRDFIGEGAAWISPFGLARQKLEDDAEKAGKAAGAKAGSAAAGAQKEAFDFDLANQKLVDKMAADIAKQIKENDDLEQMVANNNRARSDERMRQKKEEWQAQEALNDQLRDMIGLLGNMGNVGQGIGALLGIVTGNTRSVGGSLGQLLNIGTGQYETDKDGKKVAVTIGDEISKIFNKDGPFAQTMASLLQGAAGGMAAADAVFGKQSTAESIGSAIGGAAGQALGTAIGGPVGGAIGKVLGGLAGSLLGSVFTSVKWGRVNLNSSGVSASGGNDSASERAALQTGNSIFGALQDVAKALGGTVGDFGNIAVGVRHGDYRVNLNGTSLKKAKGAKDFNDDAEAAIAYAIQEAIKRGAIDGIDAATQQLLKSTDDLQSNLEKALQFQGVFTELKKYTDPVASAVGEVTKQFADLRAIFDEAGASTAQYAQLEQLLAIKRQEALQTAAQSFSEQNSLEAKALDLMGRSEDALALSRLQELAATKASLQPLQAMIYQLEDFNKTIDTFGPLAEDLKAFRKELLGNDSASSFASLAATFRTTASAAAMGDAAALGNLRGVSQDYLDAAMNNAGSSTDYQRALGQVLNAVDQGIFAADTQVDYAQAQIDAINANFDVLTQIRDEAKAYNLAIVENLAAANRLWSRFEALGMTIRTDSDTPIQVEVVS